MADEDTWGTLGLHIKARRRSLGVSTYNGSPSEPSWRKVESGKRVSPQVLYKVCSALLFEESEAREVFRRVGLDFDGAGFQHPEPVIELGATLRALKKALEEAMAAFARVEARSRDLR